MADLDDIMKLATRINNESGILWICSICGRKDVLSGEKCCGDYPTKHYKVPRVPVPEGVEVRARCKEGHVGICGSICTECGGFMLLPIKPAEKFS